MQRPADQRPLTHRSQIRPIALPRDSCSLEGGCNGGPGDVMGSSGMESGVHGALPPESEEPYPCGSGNGCPLETIGSQTRRRSSFPFSSPSTSASPPSTPQPHDTESAQYYGVVVQSLEQASARGGPLNSDSPSCGASSSSPDGCYVLKLCRSPDSVLSHYSLTRVCAQTAMPLHLQLQRSWIAE